MKIQQTTNLGFKALYMPDKKFLKYLVGDASARQLESMRDKLTALSNEIEADITVNPIPSGVDSLAKFEIQIDKSLEPFIANAIDVKVRGKYDDSKMAEIYRVLLTNEVESYCHENDVSNLQVQTIEVKISEISQQLLKSIRFMKGNFCRILNMNKEFIGNYINKLP